jgi:hypothetical protein
VQVEPTLAIGNYPFAIHNARTLGFWANKNGQALITEADLAVLRGLNLRNADGSDFDPWTKTQLRSWLLSGYAVNMSYMLSVQMAAMQLNILHGDRTGVLDDSELLVTNPDGTTRSVEVGDLILEADAQLLAQPSVLSGNLLRSYFESLKDGFDDGNNNLNWLS